MTRISVIGIGNMGLAVALRLQDLGHAVTVHDLDSSREALAREGGCAVAASPPAAAAQAELLIVVVVDAAQTRAVLFGAGDAAGTPGTDDTHRTDGTDATDGAVARLRPGACVLLCPTIAPADVEDCAARLAARGIDLIDAPMSGGPVRAREGRMSLMVATPDAVFARWQPVLAQMAQPVFRVGARAGDGARTKLVNNLLAAINLVGASEALALATRLGLDPQTTLDVIDQSSGQSWVGHERLRRSLAGLDQPLAHVALLAKDSALAMDEARRCQLPADVGAAATASFAQAMAQGLARQDDSVLYRWLLQAPPRAEASESNPPVSSRRAGAGAERGNEP
jgi:L-threonate 2-dehydrogenase